MFSINIKDRATLEVPPHKRHSTRLALLHVFVHPLISTYNAFVLYRENALDELNFDGSSIHFEYLLNKEFNNGGTTILIETIINVNQVFIPNKSHGIEPVYVHNKGVTGDTVWVGTKAYFNSLYDFKVRVPDTLYAQLNLNEFKAYIDKYRLAGKRYYIEQYIVIIG